jgi:hypothetical protein
MSKKNTKVVSQRDSAMEHVVLAHHDWIAGHPEGSLGELADFLESVESELMDYDGDEFIADCIDDMVDAADYLAGFEEPSEPVCNDGLATIEYRLGNIEDDIMSVDELIEIVGRSFKVADLPSLESYLPLCALKLVG